jgi:dipeptidyl aminopeptidase/acylaminoacyl peptidase
MFQYEQEQSRLGKTLWQDPQLYIANSPLFKVDKITTPLLLMHNDDDGAVPFEQGIEFYLALRRNGKKAWLLNYPGEPHWPVKWENRKDFQMRMSQFFDHYLQNAPMPEWMKKGIPAVDVGKLPGVK